MVAEVIGISRLSSVQINVGAMPVVNRQLCPITSGGIREPAQVWELASGSNGSQGGFSRDQPNERPFLDGCPQARGYFGHPAVQRSPLGQQPPSSDHPYREGDTGD
jgi:hypothetical protein